MNALITIAKEEGKGRPFALIAEAGEYESLRQRVFDVLIKETKTLLINTQLVTDSNWEDLAEALEVGLRERGVRQISFVGFGSACALIQSIALKEPKFVRTLTLVDAVLRPHPTLVTRFVDSIEGKLPLGLPLRSRGKGFDAKPFLQRIRCPVLVVTTSNSTEFLRSQAKIFEARLPTAWIAEVSGEKEAEELEGLIRSFEEVPARCPQKNVG